MSQEPNRSDSPPPHRPTPSPYMLSVILFAMGLWFLYDGFFSQKFAEESAEHLTFNRVGAFVLLGWAGIDFYRMRKRQLARAEQASTPPPGPPPEASP
jgi:hypothetical protein